VVPDVGLPETRIEAKRLSFSYSEWVRRIDLQESSLLFDEKDALDGESSVCVNNESGILKVRNEERENRKKLVFRELLNRKRDRSAHSSTRSGERRIAYLVSESIQELDRISLNDRVNTSCGSL